MRLKSSNKAIKIVYMCNQSTQILCNAYIHDSLHWRATMNRFRLATVKNIMLIYVHSFRLCQPLLSGGVPKIVFQQNRFCLCKKLKEQRQQLNITFMFPFCNLFKVHYNTYQWFVRLANWKKKTTAHSQNMLHVDVLYNINRKKYKTTPQRLLH